MTLHTAKLAALSSIQTERAARTLYTSSFPPEERRPWNDIVHPESPFGPHLSIIEVTDDSGNRRFGGLITIWEFDHIRYVEHFAVDETLRGSGIGAEILRRVLEASTKPLVLEVEPPEESNPMAARRIGFYRRCGLELLDYPYIQPPYSPGLPSVPLLLMTSDAQIDPAKTEKTLHRFVYKHTPEG